MWKYIDLPLPVNTIQVIFVGIRGGKTLDQPYGDIAIDDITFSNCASSKCTVIEIICRENYCICYIWQCVAQVGTVVRPVTNGLTV